MENIINYAEKELATLNEKEFNAVDSLILSQISNILLDNLVGSINSNREPVKFKDLLKSELFSKMFDKVPYHQPTKQLLFYLAASPRFRDIGINYHISKTDPISEKQFSATTFILNNTYAYVAFRGTDYSLIGWKEDFNMAFTKAIPSQIEGVQYLNTIAKLIPHSLYVGGHSKGGNIAVYASMNCNYRVSPRIIKIFSHDGPGFREEIIKSDSFSKIKGKIHKTLPHASFIGMLLENHEDYHVVKSNKFGGLRQHNPFSWEIMNSDFIYLKKISHSSQYTNETLHNWLSNLSNEERKLFIETLFNILESTNIKNFIEIFQNWKKSIPIILDSIKNMDDEVKSTIIELIKELSVLYIKTLTHTNKKDISSPNKNFISNLSNKEKN